MSAWAPGTGDASDAESVMEVDAPVAASFMDQASTALDGSMADYQTYQEQSETFVMENGADVVGGHSPVGIAEPAGSDPAPFVEDSLNLGPAETAFDPPDALTGI